MPPTQRKATITDLPNIVSLLAQGVSIIQLTTNKQRPDAVRFYEKLGFKTSHEGMKLYTN